MKEYRIKRAEMAMRNGEFTVYYQPKVHLETGRLAGMEALVRWELRDGTVVRPDDFIPFFEENGLITQLDEYVIRQVVNDLKQWKAQGAELVPVSINLSAWDLLDDDFLGGIRQIVENGNIEAELIEFELTETACSGNLKKVCASLKDLKAAGFQISLDDFGTGYSSLTLLPSIPADTIKLDRQFLCRLEEQEKGKVLLYQVITMLREMNFAVICEGVESKEHVELLQQAGCNLGQGYYFSRPITRTCFEKQFLMAG